MTPDCRDVRWGSGGGCIRRKTYTGDASLLLDYGVVRPLPVSTDGIVEGEGGGEDERDDLVRGDSGPVELAVVDQHGREERY